MKNDMEFVERDFKLRFGLKLCALTVAGLLAVSLALYFSTSRSLSGSYGTAIYTIYDLKVRVFPLFFASFYSIFILGVITAAIAIISILFSHKIAGPLFRLERTLEAVADRDLTVSAHLRGGDQLAALAEDINGMVGALNHRVRVSAESIERVKRCEEVLAKVLAEADAGGELAGEAADELRRAVKSLKSSIAGISA